MTAINIRGTSGSGKSTLANHIMLMYQSRKPVYITGRNQPLLYHMDDVDYKPLSILGHYEVDGGGCDNIRRVEEVYELVRTESTERAVLFEGLLCSEDAKWALKFLGEGHKLTVFSLSTPIELCLSSIRERRARAATAKGKDPLPLNEDNTRNRVRAINNAVKRLRGVPGAAIFQADRDATFAMIMELLKS